MLNTLHTLSYSNFTLSPGVRYNYFLNFTEEETETENSCHFSRKRCILVCKHIGSIWIPEKAMALHSSTLAWKVPWMEDPGRLQSMGSPGVGHDWATSLSLSPFMHWRRQWHPTPVFWPGESHGQRSLAGYSPWGHKESDTAEPTELARTHS